MTPPRRRTSARPPSNPSPWHGLTDADLACPGHDPATCPTCAPLTAYLTRTTTP